MKRLLTKYGVIVLSLAVVIAVILSVMAYFSTSAAPLPNVAGIIASPFRSAGAAITETVSGWVDYFTEFDALKEENEQLKLEIAEMETAIRQAEKDSEENERLRKLLDLREQRRTSTLNPPGSWRATPPTGRAFSLSTRAPPRMWRWATAW